MPVQNNVLKIIYASILPTHNRQIVLNVVHNSRCGKVAIHLTSSIKWTYWQCRERLKKVATRPYTLNVCRGYREL